jgi:hypothetical protein
MLSHLGVLNFGLLGIGLTNRLAERDRRANDEIDMRSPLEAEA